jgi:adenine-specific DNA-methyltransferase
MANKKAKTESDEGAVADDEGMSSKNTGRLELTWSNKERALLSREDGSYEWVPKRDHRVAEIRLLRDAGTIGEVHSEDDRAKDNLLIRGDALNALTALTKSPEFADEYAGKVKLVYIDPPFNTGQAFEQYDDGLEHSVWLTMMRDRLMQVKELLSLDGSVWVHLDDVEMAYCRVLLDEIFGRDNFIATVVWQKVYARDNRKAMSISQDYVLIYAKDAYRWKQARNLLPRGEAGTKDYKNPDNDPRGPWKAGDFTAQAGRAPKSQFYTLTTPAGKIFDPPDGRAWLMNEGRYQEMLADNRIYFGAGGKGIPAFKRFLSEVQDGLVPMTWWPHEEVGHNQEAKKEILAMFPGETPFDTPKPERFMERILHIASSPGDIVLDCFAGSGTTAAVAQKMGRRWVTVEWEAETIDGFTAPRLKKVISGDDDGGITKAVKWKGGGGFRVLDVAPSIFDDDEGVVVLADWVTAGELSEAVAAQLGFAYELDTPFCGRHGKVRLAVIDGHADKATVRLLVKALDKGEKLSLCATSLDPEAGELLKKLSRGSQARVVPQDILLAYRTPSAWRVSVADQREAAEQEDDLAASDEQANSSEEGDGK